MDNDKVVKLLNDNYKLLGESNAKWMDKRVKYLLARIFSGKGQTLPVEEFDWLETALSHKAGLFTSLTKVIRQTIAGLMISNKVESVEGIEELFFNKKLLKDNGFKSAGPTYFAAYQLFFTLSSEREEIVKKAFELYKEIKKYHPFITSTNDYSSMVSLAQSPKLHSLSVVEIVGIVEYYFEELRMLGLKNKERCLVSATLATLMTGSKDKELVSSLQGIVAHLTNHSIKLKGMHFVPLISLAYIDEKSKLVDLDELMVFMEEISTNVNLLFEKEYKQALALSLYAESKSSRLAENSLTTLSVSLNQIIVQEQAMMATSAISVVSSDTN